MSAVGIDADLASQIDMLPVTVELAESLDQIAQTNKREGYQPARTWAFELRESAREALAEVRRPNP